MDAIIKLIQDYGVSATIILFLLFLCAVFGAIEIYKKIKSYLDEYHNTQSTKENKEKSINERLDKLEKNEDADQKKLNEITTSISDLRKIIENVQKNQNRANIATCRSAMFRLGSELLNKGWMTQNEEETLKDLYEVYMISGAESEPTIVTRALLLPILTDEEIRVKLKESKIKAEK